MKTLTRLTIAFLACTALVLSVTAGPEPIARSYKESKEVIPPPPPVCDWSGIYIGLHVGGQFGHSENKDLDVNGNYWNYPDRPWGYSESGFVGGGQVGYNWQWHWLVLGPEFDLGYMDVDGTGTEPNQPSGDPDGHSNSDFYITLRGRIGVSLDWHGCWLLYATGGAIGVNYDTRVLDDCATGDCGGGLIDAHQQEFTWGPTVGGGIERQIGKHWSIKVEYLYFDLDTQTFSGTQLAFATATTAPVAPNGNAPSGKSDRYFFDGETAGHIVRAGLNFHF